MSAVDLPSWMRTVCPLAAETLGVRSLAVRVESVRGPVVLEPSFAVVPRRFGLPPHPWELAAALRARGALDAALAEAATLVVTHFHYDHVMAPDVRPFEFHDPAIRRRLYAGKRLYARGLTGPINPAQARRGRELLDAFPEAVQADGLDEGWITLSPPLPHGEHGSRQGWTLLASVETPAGRFVLGSDCQLMTEEAVDWILARKPAVVYTSGPPLFLASNGPNGARTETLQAGLDRLVELAWRVPIVVVDHHMARTEDFEAVLETCGRRAGRTIYSAARWLGKPDLLLEARRRALHRMEPVAREWYAAFEAGRPDVREDLAARRDRLEDVLCLLEAASRRARI